MKLATRLSVAAAASLLLSAGLAPVASAAQSVSDVANSSSCLLFDDALRLIQTNNPRIADAETTADRADAAFRNTRSEFRPQVSTFSRVGIGDGALVDNRLDNQIGVQMRQHLYDFGAGKLRRREAKLTRTAAEHGAAAVAQEVAVETASAYIDVLRLEELEQIAQAREKDFQTEVDQVKARLQQQMATLTEFYDIQSRQALAQTQRINTNMQLDIARARLARLIGVEVTCTSPQSVQNVLMKEPLPALDIAVANIVDASPRIAEAKAEITAAEAAYSRSKVDFLPSLSASAFVAYEFDDFDNTFSRRDRVGIDVQSDIFNGGSRKASRDDARGRLRGARNRLSQEQRFLTEAVTSAWVSVKAQEAALIPLRAAVTQLENQRRLREREYGLGRVVFTDVLDAAVSHYDAKEREARARYMFFDGAAFIVLTAQPRDDDLYLCNGDICEITDEAAAR